MRRTAIFAAGGLLLAGIIHIVVIFLVPYFATRDAWSEVGRFGRDGTFHVLPLAETGIGGAALDGSAHAPRGLPISLGEGPVRIRASLPDDFWSVALFDRRGRNVYSLNDRSAERTQLDLAVLTPVQMAQLRENPPASLETAIVVEIPINVGFVVLRIFVADEAELPTAMAALATADCAGTLSLAGRACGPSPLVWVPVAPAALLAACLGPGRAGGAPHLLFGSRARRRRSSPLAASGALARPALPADAVIIAVAGLAALGCRWLARVALDAYAGEDDDLASRCDAPLVPTRVRGDRPLEAENRSHATPFKLSFGRMSRPDRRRTLALLHDAI